MGFEGLHVLSLESRRATEMAQLIRKQGGEPFVAPSMREVEIEQNEEAFRFAERLSAGEFDMVILLTGVGTRQLQRVLASRLPEEAFAEALRRTTVVVRGPKPAAAAREMNVPVSAIAPEPNTWRELLAVIESLPPAGRIAVQEYGKSNHELLSALRARGAEVTPVRVYEWDLPLDVGPLREAARRMAGGEFDVVLFTTAVQLTHLMRIARQFGIDDAVAEAFRHMVVASIGPTTTESLEDFGVKPDLEPSHPRMGILVQETAERAAAILSSKRRG